MWGMKKEANLGGCKNISFHDGAPQSALGFPKWKEAVLRRSVLPCDPHVTSNSDTPLTRIGLLTLGQRIVNHSEWVTASSEYEGPYKKLSISFMENSISYPLFRPKHFEVGCSQILLPLISMAERAKQSLTPLRITKIQ
jgi:hypothetical protein